MLSYQTFETPAALVVFVNDATNSVGEVVSIVYGSAHGKYVVFYKTAAA